MKLINYALVALTTYLIVIVSSNDFHVYNFLFRNKDYAKNLEVNAYVLNETQLKDYFCKGTRPYQIPPQDLAFKGTCFLFIEVKNKGEHGCWGTLECYLFDAYSVPVNVSHPTREPKEDQYSIYLIDLGRLVFQPNVGAPAVSYKWKNLYAK